MKTILVVDDEPKITQLARDYLEHAGFAVLVAGDGHAALTQVRQRHPDLVVLDLGLPGLDGLDVTRELRRDSSIPIVMLTARDDELDKLLGLELGADDYLTKPFSPRELVARVRAVLRRSEAAAAPSDLIRAGDVVLDVPRMHTEVAGRPVELTATEFGLLKTLAASPGRIFTRSQLLDEIRGVAFESNRPRLPRRRPAHGVTAGSPVTGPRHRTVVSCGMGGAARRRLCSNRCDRFQPRSTTSSPAGPPVSRWPDLPCSAAAC